MKKWNPKIVVSKVWTRGQFHQNAYVLLLHRQIPKAQKDSQVTVEKKLTNLFAAVLEQNFALRYAIKFDEIDPRWSLFGDGRYFRFYCVKINFFWTNLSMI